jgi:hypothetical protein
MLKARARRTSGACWWGAVPVAVLLFAAPARADDPAAAKVLFDHGLDEMKQGRYASGCTAIADSYQKNPLPGALFTLAECEAKRGRFATAVKRYEEYLAVFARLPRDKQAKQHGRDGLSTTQIGALTPLVPRVTIVLGAAPPAGVVATVDGVPVDAAALGTPIPVDPGDHVVFVQAPGGSPVEKRFTVDKGDQKTVMIDVTPKPPPVEAPPPGPGGLRIAAFVTGGIGIASLAVFAVTGGLVLAKKGTIQQDCKIDGTTGVASCNAAGLAAGNSVGPLGAASTGTLIVGALALGAAVGLFIAAPPAPKQAGAAPPRVEIAVISAGPERVVLGLQGAF